MHQSNAGKHSPKIESTSVWNQLEAGTGFGKDQPWDEVPSTTGLPPKLECVLEPVDVGFSVPSKNDFSLSQSIADIASARDSLLARSLSVDGVTSTASTEVFSTTGEEVQTLAPVTFPPLTLSVGESGSVPNVNEKLPPVVPERLSLNSKEDMATENLQEIKLKNFKHYQQSDITDGIDSDTTSCYKGNFINQLSTVLLPIMSYGIAPPYNGVIKIKYLTRTNT